MGKNKLKRFEELLELERVFQPSFEEIFRKDFHLKGKWKHSVFCNNNPLILELGCGKGEYTLGLAREYPDKSFIGVDIKGARIWKGAKEANSENLANAAFLRTRIEFINSFFAGEEVDEIWLTFPDPQAKSRRTKKRLTSPMFLTSYQKFLKNNGVVHLKTDSEILYSYTLALITHNRLEVLFETSDLYNSGIDDPILGLKTFYEKQYLKEGKKITYIRFILPQDAQIQDLPDSENG